MRRLLEHAPLPVVRQRMATFFFILLFAGTGLFAYAAPVNDPYGFGPYTAQALLACYEITRQPAYLKSGTRTLDELLMSQASWQPPFMYVNVLGGFGVMNGDGEWNDSRQSLFAELIMQYGKLLKSTEYTERGIAALRASFVMMYTPLNPKTKEQWEHRWNLFNKADYGFMMENYGHGGETNPDGMGIGEFTIYDWGNGAAAETYERMKDHQYIN